MASPDGGGGGRKGGGGRRRLRANPPPPKQTLRIRHGPRGEAPAPTTKWWGGGLNRDQEGQAATCMVVGKRGKRGGGEASRKCRGRVAHRRSPRREPPRPPPAMRVGAASRLSWPTAADEAPRQRQGRCGARRRVARREQDPLRTHAWQGRGGGEGGKDWAVTPRRCRKTPGCARRAVRGGDAVAARTSTGQWWEGGGVAGCHQLDEARASPQPRRAGGPRRWGRGNDSKKKKRRAALTLGLGSLHATICI